MQFEKSEDWLVPPSSLMTCVTIRNVATDWPWACAARNEPESMKRSSSTANATRYRRTGYFTMLPLLSCHPWRLKPRGTIEVPN